jgi:hypothetical protein
MSESPAKKKGNTPACVLILAVYLASFFLPAEVTFGGMLHGTMWGIVAFFVAIIPPYTIVWAANPALWLGLFWVARGSWKKASIASVVSVVCASATLLYPNAGAGRDQLAIGYFVWLASMVILAGASLRGYYIAKCERAGKLTPELHRFLVWMPRVVLILAAIPVVWLVLTVSGRMTIVDYFATRFERPEGSAIALFLKDPRMAVRMHAADALVRAKDTFRYSEITSVLNRGLASGDPKERIATIEFLRDQEWTWDLHPPPAKLLTDPDANVRLATARLIEAKPAFAVNCYTVSPCLTSESS